MEFFFNTVFYLLAIFISIPVLIFMLECWWAVIHKSAISSNPAPVNTSLNIALLIPAHNESAEIRATLDGLKPLLNPEDRIIVVADNCSDDTAELARSCGATVYERHNSEQKGKGFALDFGLEQLSDDPPDVVIVVDADCRMRSGDIHRIAVLAHQQQVPIQSLYLMDTPSNPSPKDSVSAFAYLMRNLVRAYGLFKMGQPCLLTGTGMAFPWPIIRKASIASNNIVEDMQFGIDLAVAGHAPKFCMESHVIGVFPSQLDAAKTQRTRWEHGHIQTLLTQVPRLLKAGFKQKRMELAGLALDLSVPPLSLLILLLLASWVVCVVFGLVSQNFLPAAVLTLEGILMLFTLYLSWSSFCRERIPKETLWSIPSYFFWKLPVYAAFLFKRQKEWVRTDRDNESKDRSEVN